MCPLQQGQGRSLRLPHMPVSVLALISKVVSLCFQVCRCWRTWLPTHRAVLRSTGDRPLRGQWAGGLPAPAMSGLHRRGARTTDPGVVRSVGPMTHSDRTEASLHWAGRWGKTEGPRWVQVRRVSGSPAFILFPKELRKLTCGFTRHDRDICRGEVTGNHTRRVGSFFCSESASELFPIYTQMADPVPEPGRGP